MESCAEIAPPLAVDEAGVGGGSIEAGPLGTPAWFNRCMSNTTSSYLRDENEAYHHIVFPYPQLLQSSLQY